MEEKVLYKTLKAIRSGSGKEYDTAPDKEYLKSLENIGLIKMGWDNKITEFGVRILNYLEGKLR